MVACKLCGLMGLRGTIGLRLHLRGAHNISSRHALTHIVVWHNQDPEVRS